MIELDRLLREFPNLRERLLERTYKDKHSDCLIWALGKDRNGYGHFHLTVDGKTVTFRAHRLIYQVLRGPIPERLVLDHLCREPACCNPDHLEPVTNRENIIRAQKDHCVNGHPFDEANTYYDRGWRQCRTCKRKRDRERRAAKRASQAERRAA